MVENIQEALELSNKLAEASCDLKRSIEVFNDLNVEDADIMVFAAPNSTKRTPVPLSKAEKQVIIETLLTFTESRVRGFRSKLGEIINSNVGEVAGGAICVTGEGETLDVTEILAESTEAPTENIEHWPDREPVKASEEIILEEPKRKGSGSEKKKSGRTPRVPIETILKMVNDGYKVKDIAKQLSMDQSTVYERLKNYKNFVQQQRETQAKEDACSG